RGGASFSPKVWRTAPMQQLTDKPCRHCGTMMLQVLSRQKYCTRECRTAFRRLFQARVAALACAHCGGPLGKGKSRYCSPSCRWTYWNRITAPARREYFRLKSAERRQKQKELQCTAPS